MSKQFKINTNALDSGRPEDFYVDIKNNLLNEETDVSMSLESLTSPLTMYNINQYNNTIQGALETTTTNLGVTSFDISTGNYNITNFTTAFNSVNNLGISAVYDNILQRFTFNNTGSGYIELNPTKKQKFLGLNQNILHLGTTSIIGDQTPIFTGTNSININTDIQMESTNNKDFNSTLFKSVYPNVSLGNVQSWTNHKFSHIKLRQNNIGYQRFWITDENDDPIDLNGANWEMTLLYTNL